MKNLAHPQCKFVGVGFIRPALTGVINVAPTKKGNFYTMNIILVIILLFSQPVLCFAESAAKAVRKGNQLYKEKKYDEAIKNYNEAQITMPDSEVVNFDTGAALYKKGDYEKAMDSFIKGLTTEDPALESKANYNIGNSKYRQAELKENTELEVAIALCREALDYYKRAIELNEKDKDAKYNHEFVEKKLKTLLEKQKQSKEQRAKGKEQEEKKQQQKDKKDKEKEEQKKKQQQDQKKQQEKQQKQKGKGEEKRKELEKSKEKKKEEEKKKQQQKDKEKEEKKQQEEKQKQKEQEQKKKQEKDKTGAKPGEKKEEKQPGEAGAAKARVKPKEMSEEEARMLLQAYGQEEAKDTRDKRKSHYYPEVLKDW